MEELFKDNKDKKIKTIAKRVGITLLILIVLVGIIFGIYKYIFEPKVVPGKTEIIKLTKEARFLNTYFDLEGLAEYLDKINETPYSFKADLELEEDGITQGIRAATKNDKVRVNDFQLKFDGRVDQVAKRTQTDVELNYKNSELFKFSTLDASGKFMIYFKDLFKEHLAYDKDKIKEYLEKNKKLDPANAIRVQNLTNTDLNKNLIKEQNLILASIFNSIPNTLDKLSDDLFTIHKDIKVNYRNNSHKAKKYSIELDENQYIQLMESLKTEAKTKASMNTIEVKSLIGETDKLVEYYISYFDSLLNLSLKEGLNINAYEINGEIARIEFVKTEDIAKANTKETTGKDNTENKNNQNNKKNQNSQNTQNSQKNIIFEVEFNNTVNTREVLISNADFKLKSGITNDNNKVYTKFDLSGEIPIPAELIGEIKNPSIKIIPGKEAVEETQGQSSNLNSSLNLGTENIRVETTEANNPTGNEVENSNVNSSISETTNNNENENENENKELPQINITEDNNITKLDETLLIKKTKIDFSLSLDRPKTIVDTINFNLRFKNSKLGLTVKSEIKKETEVKIDNPAKIVTITSLSDENLNKTLDVIYKAIVKRITTRAKELTLISK